MNKFDYLRWDVKVSTITPLHIGTGRDLLQDYDYVVHGGRTWRLREDAFLQAQDPEDPEIMRRLMSVPPAQLLDSSDFQNPAFFRYVIKGKPRSQQAGSVLREQIKTSDDRPYLPGSSFKGALRTALAWHAWKEGNVKPERSKVDEGRPKFAARDYEHLLFGSDPNHDLLRALLVGDSAPMDAGNLTLANVRVLSSKGIGKDIPIEVEAVRSDRSFDLPLKVDTALFSEWARQRRDSQLGGQKNWLLNLAGILRGHSMERIKRQIAWFEKRSTSLLVDFYRQLEGSTLADNQFFVQLGWGGGWDSKTLGSRLQADPKFFDWLVTHPKLGLLHGMARENRRPGAPFPSTRRVGVKLGAGGEVPAVPLGWLLVELVERPQ